MTDLTDFITHTFKTIARAVAEAGVNADLFKHPEMISKTLKRRVSAELKRLAVLLRRLIFLMALQVELAPLVTRPARNYFEKTDGEPKARSKHLRRASVWSRCNRPIWLLCLRSLRAARWIRSRPC